MLSAVFSNAVVRGFMRQGFDKPALLRLTKLPASRLNAILSEKSHLTHRQLIAIEDAAGMTGGQLASRYLEPHGGACTDLMEELASCLTRPQSRRRHTTKKAG
jgi:hypothetical protein